MAEHDQYGLTKRHAQVGAARIAYVDEGDGLPVLLLHGCPFSSFVWRRVIAGLGPRFRSVASRPRQRHTVAT